MTNWPGLMKPLVMILDLLLLQVVGQTLTNVALKKPALGDSMYYDTSISQPRYAVDGRTLTDVWYYTCFHSSDYYWIYNPNWWIVDLLQDYTIWEVKITNRNRDAYRLFNFTIDIFTGSQDPRTLPNWPRNYGTVCHHQNDALGSSETRTLPCSSPIYGRYVRVVKYSTSSLVMCEVQVMAETTPIVLHQLPPIKTKALTLTGTMATTANTRVSCAVKCSVTWTCNIAQWNSFDNSCTWFSYSPFNGPSTICGSVSAFSGSEIVFFGSQGYENC